MVNRDRLDRSQCNVKLFIQHQDSGVEKQFGTPKNTWEDLKQNGYAIWVNAKVETLSGTESEEARRKMPRATHRVTIPYLSFLNPKHRFVVAKNQKVLEIGHLNNVGMQDLKHIIICEEKVPSP